MPNNSDPQTHIRTAEDITADLPPKDRLPDCRVPRCGESAIRHRRSPPSGSRSKDKMTDAVARTASKVPEVTLVFWIIKIAATTLGETGGDTVTMTLNWGYLLGTALFLALLGRACDLPDRGEKILPIPVLGDDRGLDHGRHHHGRLRGSVARHRLCRRIVAAVRLRHRHARRVVLVARLHIGRHCHHAEGGSVLLGRHHLLANARHRARRLDGRWTGI